MVYLEHMLLVCSVERRLVHLLERSSQHLVHLEFSVYLLEHFFLICLLPRHQEHYYGAAAFDEALGVLGVLEHLACLEERSVRS